nr:LysR substrate-binding domain-containing protein [Coralloluteibacterium stylophorae]
MAAPLGEIERAWRDFRVRSGDRLTLSLVPLVASGWLVPRLPGFVARHPDIGINLQSTTALVDFDREDVDAALRLGRGNWPGLHAEHLFDEWATPVASPALLARTGPLSEDNLGTAPLLGDPDTRPDDHAEHWRPWFARFGGEAPAHYVASFDNSETLHQAAVQGLGVALGRLTLAQPLVDAGLLVRLSRKRLRMNYAHWLVYPPRSLGHAGFLAFRAWLHAQLGREAPPPPSSADALTSAWRGASRLGLSVPRSAAMANRVDPPQPEDGSGAVSNDQVDDRMPSAYLAGAGYTVLEGDTLASIARARYGDEAAADLILEANREVIGDRETLTPGVVLSLPESR